MFKFFKKARDPWSSYTHFIGVILSILGISVTLIRSVIKNTSITLVVGVVIFNVSLICLYLASSLYHYYRGNECVIKRLRKFDHAMIYILIVGTYTPIVLKYMNSSHAYLFLSILWTIAIIGIIIKLFWLNAPRMLSTMIYLLLGWAIVFDIKSFQTIPLSCLLLIAIGGILYSIGAIIYMFKKPNISKGFGFHELFHVFVMMGSLFHYLSIYLYIL